jgi:hypothetical protein
VRLNDSLLALCLCLGLLTVRTIPPIAPCIRVAVALAAAPALVAPPAAHAAAVIAAPAELPQVALRFMK